MSPGHLGGPFGEAGDGHKRELQLATGGAMAMGMLARQEWRVYHAHRSGQIIATSNDLTPNGGLVREIPSAALGVANPQHL